MTNSGKIFERYNMENGEYMMGRILEEFLVRNSEKIYVRTLSPKDFLLHKLFDELHGMLQVILGRISWEIEKNYGKLLVESVKSIPLNDF